MALAVVMQQSHTHRSAEHDAELLLSNITELRGSYSWDVELKLSLLIGNAGDAAAASLCIAAVP